nr:hypothetical protein [Tanacetum cinerariifolium]
MANLTFANTYNIVAYLSKSDASVGFDQIVDFLNAQVIQYALMVNPTIYVSCIKQFWATASMKKVKDVVKLQALIDIKKMNEFSCSMASAVICLATGRKFNFSKYIFDNMIRNVDSPSKFLMYPRFLQVLITNQVDDLSSHTTKYTSPALTQKVFANMRRIGKGFTGIETPLFATMLVQPQAATEEENEEDETYTTLSHKVVALEQYNVAQTLEILKLKRRVKKLEKQRRSKSSSLNRLRKGRFEKKDEVNAATKEVNDAEPTVFDDKEVTMTMAQKLIKRKAEKARLLDEHMAKRLHDDEVEQAAAREKQKQDDLKRAQELQQQYDQKQENIDWNVMVEQMQEKHLDNIRKYQSLKRKPIFLAQAKKNMIVYLKNMVVYKITHFKGMTYDQVRPIFEREYYKVQTFLKPGRDEEPTKKRVAKETLLQESFKKLRAEVEVSVSEFKVKALQVKYPLIDWEIYSEVSRSYWKIIRVGGITQAYQSFKDMLKDLDMEDLDALWRLVKEKFSTAMPTEDKEKTLWVELKRLYEPNAADGSCDEDLHGGQQTKEQKEFGYILQVIKKLELKKLDDLLAGVDDVQEKALSLQMDDDDEIFNLVDLHVYMIFGGWKWQDLLRLAFVDHH